MRVAVVLVAVIVIATPVPASASCMNLGQARHQFGSVHLYWHGSDHCWDASSGRRRYAEKAQHHTPGKSVPELRQPTWREARSELITDSEPARAPQETADRAGAAPDTPPVRMMPVRVTPIKLTSFVAERWVDVEQMIPNHLIKPRSNLRAGPAPEPKVDVALVVDRLAMFTFCFGLVLSFAALSMRSGMSAIGPPSMDDASCAVRGVAAGLTEVFTAHGSYPMEVTWPDSAGAMMSRDDISRLLPVPSRLLEEARQATSRAVSQRIRPAAPS